MFASVLRPASGRLGSVCRCVHTKAFTATEGVAASTNSFASLFADTSFVRAGTHRGKHIKARVAQASPTSLKLDLGTKYASFIPRPRSFQMPARKENTPPPTVEVVVTLKATDFVQHVAGDTKPMSSHDGDVTLHRTLPGQMKFARQNARTRLKDMHDQWSQGRRGPAEKGAGFGARQ